MEAAGLAFPVGLVAFSNPPVPIVALTPTLQTNPCAGLTRMVDACQPWYLHTARTRPVASASRERLFLRNLPLGVVSRVRYVQGGRVALGRAFRGWGALGPFALLASEIAVSTSSTSLAPSRAAPQLLYHSKYVSLFSG